MARTRNHNLPEVGSPEWEAEINRLNEIGTEAALKEKYDIVRMTPAVANKTIKFIENQISSMLEKEAAACTYVAAVDEEPVIPEYSFTNVSKRLDAANDQIVAIKHALNMSNVEENIIVLNDCMSVDMLLVIMAQLNSRKRTLERMRVQLPKVRLSQRAYGSKNCAPEYQYTNYNPNEVDEEYCAIVNELDEIQIALDKHNQTMEFDVYFDKGNTPFKSEDK